MKAALTAGELEELIRLAHGAVVRGTAAFKGLDLAFVETITPAEEAAMAPTLRKMLAVLRREYRRRQAEGKAKEGGA